MTSVMASSWLSAVHATELAPRAGTATRTSHREGSSCDGSGVATDGAASVPGSFSSIGAAVGRPASAIAITTRAALPAAAQANLLRRGRRARIHAASGGSGND